MLILYLLQIPDIGQFMMMGPHEITQFEAMTNIYYKSERMPHQNTATYYVDVGVHCLYEPSSVSDTYMCRYLVDDLWHLMFGIIMKSILVLL